MGIPRGSNTGYLAHGNNKSEARGRIKHRNNTKTGEKYLEEMVIGTKKKV